MSSTAPLDALPLWMFFIASTMAIVLATECGYRLGRAWSRRTAKENEGPVGGMVAAELALLAFLLAFTFGIATSRYDTRRQVLLDEANTIGTTYLRAAMLPESHRAEVRRLLRDYVDVRIAFTAQGYSLDEALRRSEDLHGRLWAQAVAVAEKEPRSVPVGLFIQALNEVIDLHAKRVSAGLRTRIPTLVWAVLFAVGILSFAAMGYQVGLTMMSRSPAILVVALTFGVVIYLVVDLDRPSQGLLRVSQQPMIDLRNTMETPNR